MAKTCSCPRIPRSDRTLSAPCRTTVSQCPARNPQVELAEMGLLRVGPPTCQFALDHRGPRPVM